MSDPSAPRQYAESIRDLLAHRVVQRIWFRAYGFFTLSWRVFLISLPIRQFDAVRMMSSDRAV